MNSTQNCRYWLLALAILIGLGLILGMTTLVLAQKGATPVAPRATAGTTISVTITADELNGDGDCSLREALQAANTDTQVSGCPAGSGWDTIVVPAGTFTLTLAGPGEDSNSAGDLDVLESVTIIGAGSGSTILDGNAEDRIFHVDPTDLGVTLDLQDVTVTNGYSDIGGGLRQNNGLTIIRDSVFTGNVVTNATNVVSGGAIYAGHGTLQIISSTVSYNDAGYYGQGGGVHVGVVALQITGSEIEHNTASEGGGVYADQSSIVFQSTEVLSNTAAGDLGEGGGIRVFDSSLIIEENSEISFNSAITKGGGIYADGSSRLTVFDGWIHHNESDGMGGGVYAYGWGTYMRRATIEHNTSEEEGGGVYAEGDLILIDSTVRNNHSNDAIRGGGGIYGDGEYASLVISNTLVHSNTTEGDGGGVYLNESGGLFVLNSIFRENEAVVDGGGVYVNGQAGMYVEDSAFLNNHAANGGATYTRYEVGLTLERTTLSGNTAITDGGGLYLSGSSDSPADIRNCTLSDNHAGDEGGAIYSYSPGTAIESSTIANNTAGASGGGIFEDTYSIWLQNSILAGNSAAGSATDPNADCDIASFFSGGFNILGDGTGCEATRYDQSQPPGTIFGSVLASLADNGGPLLPDGAHPETHALLGGSPAIDAADDIFCPAVDERGAARPRGNGCDIGAYESGASAVVAAPSHHIIPVNTTDDELNNDGDCSLREAVQAANTDTAVDNCTAGDGWDTISLPSGTYALAISGASEDQNLTGDLDIVTGSVTIKGASAATTVIDGDDIDRVFEVANNAALRLDNVAITDGRADDGGCIRSGYGLLLTVDVVVSECLGDSSAGGIITNNGLARLVDTAVKDNTSTGENGGVYNYYGVLSIQNSQIIRNQAASLGGGVVSYLGVTRISNSDVFSNTALTVASESGGGGIYHLAGNLIVNDGSDIGYNASSAEGGGIYTYQGLVLIENSTLISNTSEREGGGYGAYYSGLVMRNALFEYNEAGDDGGGLYYACGLIQDSTIRYNESDDRGGGLRTWAVIEDSLIEGNEANEGGGIYHEGSTMFNVTVKDNISWAGDGGGLYVYNYAAQIFNSTFDGNSVESGYAGAGIYSSDLPIYSRGSTFSDNYGADAGGAIYSLEGVIDLLNSTVSGNSALQGGGLNVTSGTLSLNHSTVVSNSASDSGGGLLNGHTSVIRHSIVAGNSSNGSTSDGVADCEKAAPITFGGYSLFGSGTGCAASGRGDITVASVDVFVNVLGPLADNGGDTETHALPLGSPAIDAGDPSFEPPPDLDQRGVIRSINGRVDIGAFEAGIRVYLPLVARNHGG